MKINLANKKFFFMFFPLAFAAFFVNAFYISQNIIPSQEISLHSISQFSTKNTKAIAASCGFGSGLPHFIGDTSGSLPCGNTCSNGATNAPTCNICSAGFTLINGQCQATSCTNGATNFPTCNVCSAGFTLINGQCQATSCTNGATNFPTCSQCPANQVLLNNVCTTPITDFTVTNTSINPNGSTEFSWRLNLPPGVGSNCGFVDLTTPTPRPIPGLQNLDPNTDRVRITNIQNTTRFCLVCQFYSLINNSNLGDAAVHQWIRVIRIGEN